VVDSNKTRRERSRFWVPEFIIGKQEKG